MTSSIGHVDIGGPSLLIDLGVATLRKCAVTDMANNAYLITCEHTGKQALIDAAGDTSRLVRLIDEGSGDLSWIITTHRHWDHVRSLVDLADQYRPILVSSTADNAGLPVQSTVTFGGPGQLTVGEVRLRIDILRGHTAAGLLIDLTIEGYPTHLLVGDSLFPGGVGKTSDPDQDFSLLLGDVTDGVFNRYGDDAVIHPGHGDDTVVGIERPHLPRWRDRGW